MGRRKKLINNSCIPQYAIEAVARCVFPDILAFYESEEGQREFAEWKRQRETKDGKDTNSGQPLENTINLNQKGGKTNVE